MTTDNMLSRLYLAKHGIETVAVELELGSEEQNALLDANAKILEAYLLISKREIPCSP